MDSLADKRQRRRRFRFFLGTAISLSVFLHASTGIRWSTHFHPDELTIAHWMLHSHRHGYPTDRAYAGGWFVLAGAKDRIDALAFSVRNAFLAHATQAGRINAMDATTFDVVPERVSFRTGDMQRGRDLNVWLVALAALFLYLAALELGAGAPAAAAGALLLGAHPFVLLHAHYCESDSATPFALCLAGWWAACAVRRNSPRWFFAAMAAAGFAIACKFTLVALALWPLTVALPLACGAGRGAPRMRRFAALAACGLAALALGFLAGTPAFVRSPRLFLASLQRESALVYAESVRSLGAAHRSTAARYAWRAAAFWRELARLGPPTLAFFGLSAFAWLRRSLRRHVGALPLLLFLFPFQAVFLMPWIRNQELLCLVPPLCLGAALAVDHAARIAFRHGPAARRAAACLFLAAAACGTAQTACDGRRILTSFLRRDTRAECQNWLAETAGDDVVLALDSYVSQAIRGTDCSGVGYFLPAESWPSLRDQPPTTGNAPPPRYILRNASSTGRFEPTPEWAAHVAAFRRDCLPLRSWTLAPGRVRPTTFAQPDIELWALPDPRDALAPDLPVVLDRPVYFTPGMRPLYAAADPSGVGPVRAVQTVGRRHAFHPVPDAPGWAVSRMVAGPGAASVAWEGFAEPRKRKLSGRGVAIFGFDAAALRRCALADVRPLTRLRLRDADDQTSICATWPVADRAEAARALRRGGAPDEALALLRTAHDLDAAAKTEAFLAAADAGEAPDPDWTASARDALTALRRVADTLASGDDGIRVRGIPLRVLRDFAHVRLFHHDQPRADALPVFLPAGTYRVSILPGKGDPLPPADGVFPAQTGAAGVHRDAEGRDWWRATLAMKRDGILAVAPADPAGLAYHRLQVDWDPAEQLPRLAAELERAFRKVR